MVQSNKILTVSYGTFSCTLEGFDDSFGTMKAIAEYFRDLASDDRYFGAEPPVPDAEMMARIAQREISRKVEARTENGRGIVLRAGDPDTVRALADDRTPPLQCAAAELVEDGGAAPCADLEPVPAPAAESAAPAPVEETPHAAADATAGLPEPEGDGAAMADLPPGPDTAVDGEDAATPLAAEAPETPDTPQDAADGPEPPETAADGDAAQSPEPISPPPEIAAEPAPDAAAAGLHGALAQADRDEAETIEIDGDIEPRTDDTPETAPEAGPDIDTGEGTAAAESQPSAAEEFGWTDDGLDWSAPDDATAEPAMQPDAFDAVREPADDPAIAPAGPKFTVSGLGDTIAAKLQRIRAVVSRNETAALAGDESLGMIDDEPADAFVAQVAEEMTEALNADADTAPGQVLKRLEDDDAPPRQPATEGDGASSDADAPSDEPMALIHETGVDGAADRDLEPAAGTVAKPEELAQDRIPPADARNRAAPAFTTRRVGPVDAQPRVAIGYETDTMRSILALTSDDDTRAPDLDEAHAGPEVALAPPPVKAAEAPQDGPAPGTGAPGGNRPRIFKVQRSDLDAALTAGAIEELDREPAPDAPGDTVAASGNAPTSETAGPAPSAESETCPIAAEDRELTRLMDMTEQKMGEEPTVTARETYSHARAAADLAGPRPNGLVPDVDDAAYRQDLARIIRPRRPVAGAGRSDRTAAEPRPAPLKLIAEQRVDYGVQPGPVRPRRVTADAIEDFSTQGTEDGSFAEFATEMGAEGLPELLEAAAAYMSFVEGRAQFSRPQLMNKVRQIDTNGFNREDGLRSFGQLLREGKIEKTGGGRFAASGEIGFRPDERAAG